MKKSVILLVICFLVLSFSIVSASQLKVTSEHPFLVNGNWIPASQLQVGDKLKTSDGKQVVIKNITEVEDRVEVYNLEASPYSDFVVSDGVIVHNSNELGEVYCNACLRGPCTMKGRWCGGVGSDKFRETMQNIQNTLPNELKGKIPPIRTLDELEGFVNQLANPDCRAAIGIVMYTEDGANGIASVYLSSKRALGGNHEYLSDSIRSKFIPTIEQFTGEGNMHVLGGVIFPIDIEQFPKSSGLGCDIVFATSSAESGLRQPISFQRETFNRIVGLFAESTGIKPQEVPITTLEGPKIEYPAGSVIYRFHFPDNSDLFLRYIPLYVIR